MTASLRPEDWQRIDRLFNRLLDLPDGEQARRLATCGEPVPIVDAVRAMLAADARSLPTIRKAIREAAEALSE